MTQPVWSERLGRSLSPLMNRFGSSIGFDIRLWSHDIRGSIAYARELARIGIIAEDELKQIVAGLEKIHREFESGEFRVLESDEDIHMAVERRLTELIGSTAGKLHTGRSRNDQVATDMRLWLMEAIHQTYDLLTEVGTAIVDKSESHLETIMPGYTHLQHSNPVSFAHFLMGHFWPLLRDRQRLKDCLKRTKELPLGSGAMAGSAYPVNRRRLAEELGFERPAENSIDAVASRDFCLEFMAAAAISMVHLSRLAEDLIILATGEFDGVRIDDSFSTGSSLLPQKRNPDSLELIRGKAGRATGNLVSLLTVLKGLPSSYNKDLQEDKESLFDSCDTWQDSLRVMAGVVKTLDVNPENLSRLIDPGTMAADLVVYLVTKGLPFREAHKVVSRLVRDCEESGKTIDKLGVKELQKYHTLFDDDARLMFDPGASIRRRGARGGTAPERVKEQLELARKKLGEKLVD